MRKQSREYVSLVSPGPGWRGELSLQDPGTKTTGPSGAAAAGGGATERPDVATPADGDPGSGSASLCHQEGTHVGHGWSRRHQQTGTLTLLLIWAEVGGSVAFGKLDLRAGDLDKGIFYC